MCRAANAVRVWCINLVLSSIFISGAPLCVGHLLAPYGHYLIQAWLCGDIFHLQMRKPVVREVKPLAQYVPCHGREVIDRNSFGQRSNRNRPALSVPCGNWLLFAWTSKGLLQGAKDGSPLLEHPHRQLKGSWDLCLDKDLSVLKSGPGLG